MQVLSQLQKDIMHPLLSTISLDACTRIGDEGLMSVGLHCYHLLSVTVDW